MINNDFFNLDEISFKDLLDGKTPWYSIANLKKYIEEIFSLKKLVPNYSASNPVFIGKNSSIHPSVEITGPAIIGNNCEIRHGAFLRDCCLIGNDVIIGHAVEFKNSIALNNSAVAHLNYIGDSIIGNNSNVSGGTILANYRLDKNNIQIKNGDERIDTDLLKFGSVIGDNSNIGVNCVLNPGTIIGKNTIVFPLKSVNGVYKENSIIK